MQLAAPLFAVYTLYAAVSLYLPVLLSAIGFSAAYIGLLQGIFEAVGILCPFLIVSAVDRRGNYGKAMLFFGVLMLATAPVLIFAGNFLIAAAVLVLFAVGFKSVIPVSDAYASVLLGAHKERYGHIRVIGSAGFILAALFFQFSGVVDDSSPKSIVFWIAALALVFVLVMICTPRFLKTGEKTPIENPENENDKSDRSGVFSELMRLSPSFWFGVLLIFLGSMGLVPSQKFFSLYVQDELKLDLYPLLWAIGSISETPFMFFSDRFIIRFGSLSIIKFALFSMALRNVVYALFPSFTGALAGQLFHSVSYGLFHPAAIVFIAERVNEKDRALGMSLYTAFALGCANVIGNILGGVIIEYCGYTGLFVIFSLFPLLGFVLSSVALRKR